MGRSLVNKLIMVDVWTGVDDTGKPVGHGIKVGNEYYEYVKDHFTVIQYVNNGISSFLQNPNAEDLPYDSSFCRNKYLRFWNIIKNLNYLCLIHKEGLFWFYAPDFYTYLAVLLCNIGKRSVLIAFEDYETSKMKHRLFCLVKKKAAGMIITNRKLYQENDMESIYVPDYAYEEAKYAKYEKSARQECAVCLGTMNRKKLLEEAIYAFNKNGYKLLIYGKFEDSEYYNSLCRIALENISLENRYIDEEEYYQLLGGSKFCLIPYDNSFYKNRTSGVLQEAMFMRTVPISHKEILEFNDIPGVGYDNISDLSAIQLESISMDEKYERYETMRKTEYSLDEIIRKLNGFLIHLTDNL